MPFDIFLSHSSSNRTFARQLASELRRGGHSVFFDEGSIRPGQRWEEEIRDALASSKSFVSVLDHSSASSTWSAFELGAALGNGLPVVSVIAAGVSRDQLPDPVRHVPQVTLSTPGTTASDVTRLLDRWWGESGLTSG